MFWDTLRFNIKIGKLHHFGINITCQHGNWQSAEMSHYLTGKVRTSLVKKRQNALCFNIKRAKCAMFRYKNGQSAHVPVLNRQSAHVPVLKRQNAHVPVLKRQSAHVPVLNRHNAHISVLNRQSAHVRVWKKAKCAMSQYDTRKVRHGSVWNKVSHVLNRHKQIYRIRYILCLWHYVLIVVTVTSMNKLSSISYSSSVCKVGKISANSLRENSIV